MVSILFLGIELLHISHCHDIVFETDYFLLNTGV